MTAGRVFSGLAARAARRPLLTLGLLAALGIGSAAVALTLRPAAAIDTLVGRSSGAYRETQRFYARFGEEPVEVLVKGDLRKLVLSSDIDRLVGLEGCLSGNVPAAALAVEGGPAGPCGQLRASKAVKVVFGPGTFLNEAALQVDGALAARSAQAEREAAQAQAAVLRSARARGLGTAEAASLGEQARKATMAGFAAEVSALAIRYGLSRPPTLDDHGFVSQVVFDSSKPSGTPKQRFAYLFPSREAALVSVRLRAGLSEAQRARAIALIRQAVAMRQWRLGNGETYLVTGEPAILADLAGSLSRSLELSLAAVLLVMALALGLVFNGRPRLLPLAVAVLAAALTFGVLALTGAALTMASVAVLPVLVGLSVDYAIQFQSRIQEALAAADDGPAAEAPAGSPVARGMVGGGSSTLAAVRLAAADGAPTIATAALASMGGLLVLLLSPVPMVRGFGLLLAVGVALAFVCALAAGSAAAALAGRRGHGPVVGGDVGMSFAGGLARARALKPLFKPIHGLSARAGNSIGVLRDGLAPAWRGAREIVADNALTRLVSQTALQRAVARPGRVLGIGLVLAALGWGLDTQAQVQTDIAKLAPQGLPSLRNLAALEQATGVGGEIDLMISSSSLTDPRTIEWMSSYERGVLSRFGYSASAGCGGSAGASKGGQGGQGGGSGRPARLCPAFSLPDLFASEATPGAKLSRRQVAALLAAVPPYFSQAVISPDRGVATLAFGIRLMSLQQQQAVIEGMRASLHPPAGVHAQLVGLSVLAAQAGAQVASPWRRVLTLLVALAAVAAILLGLFRGDRRRALVPLVPVALASGWSALVLFALRIPLNPMSVTLGALVVAISTEFSVLLCERHRRERLRGLSSAQALRRAYASTGAAVAASGVTAIAGFAVLALSDIAMLRDFGLVTLVDLSVALLGVWMALPAALMLAERERAPVGLAGTLRERLGRLSGSSVRP